MKAQLTQVKACEYFHELMEYLFDEENLKEAEKLSVSTTNRGFYQSFTRPPRPQDAAEIAEIHKSIRDAVHQRELKQVGHVKFDAVRYNLLRIYHGQIGGVNHVISKNND